ncbi:MAG: ATP-binding protein, partial [Planctomycetota bacterium]|jgi:C4-dicarboxylate-specific signal transduction histidine kinase
LLLEAETDENKKQMLGQIQSRTDEISQIVSDLLAFAQPAEPQKRSVSIRELLDKAVEKTCRQCGQGSIEIEITGDGTGDSVYVDVHQIAQSVSCVLTNALQSYKGGNGPVWIDCGVLPDGKAVSVAIRDTGCGMNAETAAKATQPFFSFCPAGRRRGMASRDGTGPCATAVVAQRWEFEAVQRTGCRHDGNDHIAESLIATLLFCILQI